MFQNLIGMLGRKKFFHSKNFINSVSKPYRYARKMKEEIIKVKERMVSKPYRYARKLYKLSRTFEVVCFKTL